MTTDGRIQLAFSGLAPQRQRLLTAAWGGPEQLVAAILSGRVECPSAMRAAVAVSSDHRLAALGSAGASLVFAGEAGFPDSLCDLPDSPAHLFVRGAPLVPRAAVAVVGTRRATAYGLRVAERVGRVLAETGIVVVSGLARGIDGAAHRGVVEGNGTGWAVLGCGVDRWYPRNHDCLGEALLECGGSVVSEYPPGTEPAGWRFPLRNRIISGLSTVVIIVEAAVKGGALITARLAMEQGREVFAVPGDIDRAVSEGCNRLIADGAIPLTSIDDLLEGLGFLRAANPGAPSIPGLEVIGPLGATPHEIGVRLGLDPTATRVQIGRWEAVGVVRRRGEMVERT